MYPGSNSINSILMGYTGSSGQTWGRLEVFRASLLPYFLPSSLLSLSFPVSFSFFFFRFFSFSASLVSVTLTASWPGKRFLLFTLSPRWKPHYYCGAADYSRNSHYSVNGRSFNFLNGKTLPVPWSYYIAQTGAVVSCSATKSPRCGPQVLAKVRSSVPLKKLLVILKQDYLSQDP